LETKLYQFDRIDRLAKRMKSANIDDDIIAKIMEGGEKIDRTSKPILKAAWFKQAVTAMDELLDLGTRKLIQEGGACCLTGKRQEISKAIARDHKTLEDRIKAANEAKYVFGHSVMKAANGNIIVQFQPAGLGEYHCPCMSKAQMTMPITYCFCCGGHAKHHLQTALGIMLDCTVVNSVRSSGGKKPCTFSFKILE
jgi:hypothetical protein